MAQLRRRKVDKRGRTFRLEFGDNRAWDTEHIFPAASGNPLASPCYRNALLSAETTLPEDQQQAEVLSVAKWSRSSAEYRSVQRSEQFFADGFSPAFFDRVRARRRRREHSTQSWNCGKRTKTTLAQHHTHDQIARFQAISVLSIEDGREQITVAEHQDELLLSCSQVNRAEIPPVRLCCLDPGQNVVSFDGDLAATTEKLNFVQYSGASVEGRGI
ncbi:hypothetical protein VT03_01405 [Planctomyces sp. SH-PL14]|nr:hypothetical protein VT03_01405 [Planctomyces sp. SH-PL14]